MTPPRLIAFYSSTMGSGKSALAGRLVDAHGFQLVKFAGPLKEMATGVLRALGHSEDELERMVDGDLKEVIIPEIGKSPRELFQTLGTEWGRQAVHPNLWVHLAARSIELALRRGPVVVDDVRFANEAVSILAMGGRVLEVLRPGALKYNSHQSEGLLDNLGLPLIRNDGTLEDLHRLADHLAAGLL